MKKNIEKILASAGLIIALVLIVILIVTAFGGIEQSEFDNQLVRGLVITLSVLYLVLAVSSLTMLFLGSDAVREITLRSEQGGSCKATLGVIRRLVKETFYGLEGVKTGKVTLIVNEYGVKLKVAVRITDRDVFETETYLRTLLEEVFKGALGFKFHAIEFKIVSLQARFKPDKDKVDAAVAEKVAEHTANYAVVPNSVEQTSFGGDAARPKRRASRTNTNKSRTEKRRSLRKRTNMMRKKNQRRRRQRRTPKPKTRNERSLSHPRRARRSETQA